MCDQCYCCHYLEIKPLWRLRYYMVYKYIGIGVVFELQCSFLHDSSNWVVYVEAYALLLERLIICYPKLMWLFYYIQKPFNPKHYEWLQYILKPIIYDNQYHFWRRYSMVCLSAVISTSLSVKKLRSFVQNKTSTVSLMWIK